MKHTSDQETAKMQCRILETLYVMYYSKQQQQQWKTDQKLFFRYDLVTKLFTWWLQQLQQLSLVIEPTTVTSHNKLILNGVAPEFGPCYYKH